MKVLLQNNQHKHNLGGRPDTTLYTSTNAKEWEQWSVGYDAKLGGWHLKSHHNTFIGSRQDATLYLSPHVKEWEVWNLGVAGVPIGVKVLLKTFHGKQMGCRPDKTLYASDNKLEWEQFIINDLGHGKVRITSAAHAGKNLGSNPKGEVYSHENALAFEEWVIHHGGMSCCVCAGTWVLIHMILTLCASACSVSPIIAKGIHIVSPSHHMALGARPDGTFYTSTNRLDWETWQIIKL